MKNIHLINFVGGLLNIIDLNTYGSLIISDTVWARKYFALHDIKMEKKGKQQ